MTLEYALTSTRQASAPAPFAPLRTAVARLSRRVRARLRLATRNRRAWRRHRELCQLDEFALHDLGLARSEVASVVAELGGRAAATRRRTDLDFWLSASSRLRVRHIDSFL